MAASASTDPIDSVEEKPLTLDAVIGFNGAILEEAAEGRSGEARAGRHPMRRCVLPARLGCHGGAEQAGG